MAIVINCTDIASEINKDLKKRVKKLDETKKSVGLAAIIVGDDDASRIYVHNKEKACQEIGIISETFHLPTTATQRELEALVSQIKRDKRINGIIIQLPLPQGLDADRAMANVLPKMDVDGLHAVNIGRLSKGLDGFIACTPKGIMRVLDECEIPLEGKHAVVVGRSNIVGKPIAMALLNRNCTVTVCHSHTENLSDITSTADILVVAVGSPNFITADMVKEGAVVIDVGINKVEGQVVGDVDFEHVEPVAGYITPVPGGIGKMTVAMLMENTVEAAEGKYKDAYSCGVYEYYQ